MVQRFLVRSSSYSFNKIENEALLFSSNNNTNELLLKSCQREALLDIL